VSHALPLVGYIPLAQDGLTPIFQPFGNMLSAHLMILFFWQIFIFWAFFRTK
jgi:hypothetical protein